ncbi:hypothetical protein ACIA5C_06965 [Actinoplanes sp. NPDC051343]|uniref:hypothetical protein n=1 Tax=Actinoplanes sp. NPDC051343 TaxID=3363906 RepID=UPI0037B36156
MVADIGTLAPGTMPAIRISDTAGLTELVPAIGELRELGALVALDGVRHRAVARRRAGLRNGDAGLRDRSAPGDRVSRVSRVSRVAPRAGLAWDAPRAG